MKTNLDEKYEMALQGRSHWLEMKKKYGINDEWGLIIIPDVSADICMSGVKNLGFYLRKKILKNALVIITDNNRLSMSNFDEDGINIEIMKNESVEEILMYYKLHQFFRNIVVVSVDEPFGTSGIIGKCEIGIDEYVRDALYV